jgi:prolyl-tRNA synthetase
MTEENKKVDKKITPRNEDYSQWYLDIIDVAELAENSSVRGCMIIKPYGYSLWENTQKVLDKRFKELGVKNAYFPIFIPEKLIKKEGEHVEGFAPEVATVTHAGGKKLEEPVVVRPTSETIIYETFSNWIDSYRELPLLINQWANVVRWEMRTRLFLRTTEFLWQEGHTVHETDEEADKWAKQMLEVYKDFAQNHMAIPVILGTKTDSEKFAGAHKTYCLEAMMQDGKALQFATSHHLGQNFAKAFDVTFLDRNQERQFGWQTSWGLSTRTIGGLIMTHSDDKGLVLPPKITPIHFAITTIYKDKESKDKIDHKATEIKKQLESLGYVCEIDNSDERPGEKFYKWEKKGVPVRIELGEKDLETNQVVFARRDNGEKEFVKNEDIQDRADKILKEIQNSLFEKAKNLLKENTVESDDWEAFKKQIEDRKFVLAHWSGEEEIEKQIKEETGATIRCIPFDSKEEDGVCIKSGKPSKRRVIFAKAY